jgi:thioredoxin 1
MNTYSKFGIVITLLTVIAAAVYFKGPQKGDDPLATGSGLPRLVDLGADSCIPCKLMAPILEDMRKEYTGRLRVDFIDVWKNPDEGKKYGVHLIPTQILYDASGKELERHEGFISKEDILAKFSTHGVSLATPTAALVRETPLVASTRPADQACFMCDGDIQTKTLVEVKTTSGNRRFCSPHCFFIYLSSLPKPEGIEDATTVTPAAGAPPIAAKAASYRYQYDAKGYPAIEVLAEKGVVGTLNWEGLKDKEFAVRCAFCDRVTYPDDSCRVTAGGASLYACCPVCGLGVAARLQKDLILEGKDALTGQVLKIATLNGSVAEMAPTTLIAWHGQSKNAEGKMVSAGCFKQYFFGDPDNLKKWLDQHPEATGKMATIGELLADKMKLSPQQIKNACKIGDCAN